MPTTKQKIQQAAAERRRTSFREEFYKDSSARSRASRQATNARRGNTRRFSPWVTVSGLGILLCLIAIGGSSAMIWLRRLGALFGVHWVGD